MNEVTGKVEFHEKLLQLRKNKGMTQEQLAESLFVSRTAISKWESGKGYPNIDSLKSISKLFGVTIDELLSGEELITLASSENKSNIRTQRGLLFGILDILITGMFFLPLFGQQEQDAVQTVTLLAMRDLSTVMRMVYYSGLFALILLGTIEIVLCILRKDRAQDVSRIISFSIHAIVILFYVLTRQPYATSFLFMLFIVKVVNSFFWTKRSNDIPEQRP